MSDVRRINLALQGGGAHGAYSWGVLDRLLEDDGIEIAGISGTSAGALNGAAVKAGLARGGRQDARDNLDWLWAQMGAVGDMRMPAWWGGGLFDPALFSHVLEQSLPLPLSWAEGWNRLVSPYAYGPLYDNPLRRIADRFDFDAVCAEHGPRLFVCATNVRTGKVRIFTGDEIGTEALLASACLPTLFQAVEIEDEATGQLEAYWDGGYTGNPALFPLFDRDLPDDVVVVNINPLVREELPRSPQDIQNRINEISFNSSLLRELRAIAFVQRLLEDGHMERGRMKRVLVHMIADDDLMTALPVGTKMTPLPGVLARLKAAGRRAAEAFLDAHRGDLGQRGTVDLPGMFG